MSSNITGLVSAVSSKNTIVVKVDRALRHPLYRKAYTRSSKFYVHDAKEVAKIGDKVEIKAIPPMSKQKRWELVEVVNSGDKK